jgi:hypothetical protein
MASYAPPSNNLTIFNPDQFLVDSSLLEFPVAQGAETFPFGLTTSTATVVGALTAGATVVGALTAGASTLSSVSTNTITGATIQVSPATGINIADNLTSGTINIGRQDATSSSTTVSIAGGNGQTGTINIGTGTGTKIMGIGGTNTTLNLVGTTTINTSGSKTTSIGNATGATTITNGSIAPTLTGAYQTLNVPYIGSTYFSSFSKATVADATAYFVMSTALSWNTYSGTSWDANGGITLPIGFYNAYLALNLDGSATSITDMRMAFLTTSSNPASTEANWTDNLPYTYLTVVSSPRNYTMYFHKTDSCDNSVNDTEQFNISGCVYLDGSTVLYPCVRWNRGATNSTLRGTIIFTRIG